MPNTTHYLYSDASFSKEKQLAVAAYLVFETTEQHNAGVKPESLIRTISFHEVTNIRAELMAILLAMETLKQYFNHTHHKIKIFTDCQAATRLISRREKLEGCGFTSRRRNQVMPNADLYKRFFLLCDQLQPELIWVKGHSPRHANDLIQKNFRVIDQMARKELREKLRT